MTELQYIFKSSFSLFGIVKLSLLLYVWIFRVITFEDSFELLKLQRPIIFIQSYPFGQQVHDTPWCTSWTTVLNNQDFRSFQKWRILPTVDYFEFSTASFEFGFSYTAELLACNRVESMVWYHNWVIITSPLAGLQWSVIDSNQVRIQVFGSAILTSKISIT